MIQAEFSIILGTKLTVNLAGHRPGKRLVGVLQKRSQLLNTGTVPGESIR